MSDKMPNKNKVGFWGLTGLILSGLLLGLLLGISVCYLLGSEEDFEDGVSGEASVTREGANVPKDNMAEDGIMGENIALELPGILADSIDETKTFTEPENEEESESISNLEDVEQKWLLSGRLGDLGLGDTVCAIPNQENEDYKLYFFESDNGEISLDKKHFNLDEADYVFPDVREGNVSIGKFLDIYAFEGCVPLKENGTYILISVARYEVDGKECYDTRIYEEDENGYRINESLMQELNEKYRYAEDYPLEEIVEMPHD